ncbi:unnamed protein product [Mycena citricolor]|uniref:MARVEL domain-containing protein n=1 Tax=Mycena citricolor TaxID=2018698 RepID=A0AAD2HKJ8_9AGAR|nr:unnamed protein product [Mycena citricolor]
MTVRFTTYRMGFYVAVFLLAGTVLGLDAHFAGIFLPHLHPDFTIFALLIPSMTIFAFLLLLNFSQPRIEVPVIFVLWALWLAMGAWSTDIIGPLQCDALTTETMPTRSGQIRQREYCYEMKVIQAFSWMIFVMFSFAFGILLSLVQQAERFGRVNIWEEPIQELGWFHEMPGYYNSHQQPMMPAYSYPQGYGYQMPQVYVQNPQQGAAWAIQTGPNGPTVTQVPPVNV